MNAQDLILYGIVRKRLYGLLRPENIDFFSGIQLKLYEACFLIKLRKVNPTPEIIKNYIFDNKDLKEKEKNIIINHLSDIIKGEKYIDILSIESVLEYEWYEKQFIKLQNTLVSKETTLEMKKNVISKTAEIINTTKKIDDFKNIKTLLKSNRDNPKVRQSFKDKLIYLKNENLKAIFNDIIYPQPYSILGRPGDLKSSLLFNLIVEFDELNQKGIIVSFEDTADMLAFKIMAIKSGETKINLMLDRYNPINFDNSMSKLGNNIFVMDKMRTANELYIDLYNKLSVGKYKWLAVDFMQRVKKEKYMGDYETISDFDSKLMELYKEFQMPIFRLTQTSKDHIQSGKLLGMGNEKGSGDLSQNSRYALSLNKINDDQEGDFLVRIINIYKTTFSKRFQIKVWFQGNTGKIFETKKGITE